MKKRHKYSSSILMALALPAFFLAAAPVSAAGVQAGTVIENTATATYINGASTQTVSSNTVSITVDEILDVAVISMDGGNVSLTDEALLTFQVTNSGNGDEAFEINVDTATSGDDFDPDLVLIAYDSNGNGVYDSGTDTVLTSGANTPSLSPDASLLFFVIASLPLGTADAAIADVELSASAITGTGSPGSIFAGQGNAGSDAVVGSSTALDEGIGQYAVQLGSVSLTKSALVSDQFGGDVSIPGAIITYSLLANIAGSGTVADLLITDVIPEGTTYQSGTLTLNGNPLTDGSGDDAGEASAAGIEVVLGDISGGNSDTIQFSVEIN